MSLRWPARLPLANAPTPLERLPERPAGGLPAGLWVKRDDLTGVGLSGNKVRKLEFLAAEAVARGARALVTCGGVNSNHARATAVAAARLGLTARLVLRGEDRRPPAGNLVLDRWLGARITFITEAQWADRDALLAEAAGDDGYVIPEGGSNALGSLGYARAAQELLTQAEAAGLGLRHVVHACGSGGTTAGLALALAAAGREDVELLSVAVCNDAAYFDARVHAILDEAVARGWATPEVRGRARWRILDGHKGPGYARTTPEALKAHAQVARAYGLFVDPVYTGKALLGLADLTRRGELAPDATVFVHTGGIFELFAFADALAEL
jgi:D-cysteine desulfhydrase